MWDSSPDQADLAAVVGRALIYAPHPLPPQLVGAVMVSGTLFWVQQTSLPTLACWSVSTSLGPSKIEHDCKSGVPDSVSIPRESLNSFLPDRCSRTSKWFSFSCVLGVFPAGVLSLVLRARLYTSPLRIGSPFPITMIFLVVIPVSFRSLAF